ncbi:MAG TPA: S8 family serine peptidase [Gammaproteobacteria bacterium]
MDIARGALDLKAVASYAAYLGERQEGTLTAMRQALGRALLPRFQYRYALNGMSVRLTPVEAERIAGLPQVLSVKPVRRYAPSVTLTVHNFPPLAIGTPAAGTDTNASRDWIGAPAVWQLPTNGTDNEGEGVVLADLDTGINSANASFHATGPRDNYVAADPGGLRFGVCDSGNAGQSPLKPSFFQCNDKLLGGYTYTQDTSNDPGSPEDSEGHGSHTASTAVGNFVNVTMNGATTHISGVAPHASLIVYDVCDPTDLCSTDASVAAVEQAIQDQQALKAAWGSHFKGMVLNFSIGGGDAFDDPVEQAFLSAVQAGIYVSAAGGNGGPSNVVLHDPDSPTYPVEHVGPWVATNAASTHDGSFTSNNLENLSGGVSPPAGPLQGAGFTAGFGPNRLVYAGSGDFDGDDPVKGGTMPTSGEQYPASLGVSDDARQCLYPFSAHTFASTDIVVCDRGTIALVDKAYNVKQGGAGGLVIKTTSGSSQDLPVETYLIPATLLALTEGNELGNWIAASTGSTLTAQISGSTLTTDPSHADELAGFSSRGPTGTRFDALVKPDLTAPGVDVLAAVSNPAHTDGCGGCASKPESYDFYQGTSMATPHDSGAAALLMQAHPHWTPPEVKSALMLTAVTTGLTDQCKSLDSGENCVAGSSLPSPQVRGAGRIDVEAAQRTGIVMDVGDFEDGDLTVLNLPSLGNDTCAPTCVWSRVLSSAFSSATVNYSVSVSHLSPGLQVRVSPAHFTLVPGDTVSLSVTADTGALPKDKWAFAQVDITTSDTGDAGTMVPDMHLALAARATVPAPHMSIRHDELSYTVTGGQAAETHSFTIKNDGRKTLHWSVALQGGPTGVALDCKDIGMPGLSLGFRTGSVLPNASEDVSVTFEAGNLATGHYDGEVCVNSDASDNPQIVLPVSAQVKAASGGGGGGGFGLLSLAALALVLKRQMQRD